MSKAEWYGNVGFVPVKDNYEEMSLKKEKLQQQFVSACLKKTSNSSENKKVKNKNKSFDVKEKEIDLNIDLDKEKIKCLQKDIKTYKKTVSKMQAKEDKLKKERFELIKDIKNKDDEIEMWKNKVKELNNKIGSLNSEKEALKNEIEKINSSKDREELKKLRLVNNKLRNTVKSLSSNLKKTKKELQNYQLIRTGDTEGNLIKKYKIRLQEKENEADNLKSKYKEATATINALNNKLLKKKIAFLKKKTIKHKEDIARSSEDYSTVIKDTVKFGFISLNKENQIIFVDINGGKHKLSSSNNLEKLSEHISMPVRARKDNDEYFIECIYYTLANGLKAKALNSDKNFNERIKRTVSCVKENEFENKKVLIIGSRFKDKYMRLLNRAGAKGIWHESYSDSETRIPDLSRSADVVILCTSHSSHSVRNQVIALEDFETNPHKYQMLEVDNVTNIAGRIRYALENKSNL